MTHSPDSSSGQYVSFSRTDFWGRIAEVSSSVHWLDILVFTVILGFGAIQFYFVSRATDFWHDDVFWADSARSLIQHGFFGINGYPETNQPPGLAAVLALLCRVGACGHIVFLRAMTVFGTLGFLVTYQLLRRQAPRAVAAAICLLLISAPIHFQLTTEWIIAYQLYFFSTMSALLVDRKFEEAARVRSKIGLGALLAALVALSLTFASAAIAFLAAIVASVSATFLRDRRVALVRLRNYAAILLVGIAAQGLWVRSGGGVQASAGISAQEWPVAGFPQSYVAQLKVKDGNYPELGFATPRDYVVRIFRNAAEHANLLSESLLRILDVTRPTSALVLLPMLLIVLGWGYSILGTGGNLQDWYFAGYEAIYLLWPWHLEYRFFLPIAPLACLYMWRGASALALCARNRPRELGVLWLPVALLIAAFTWIWAHRSGSTGQVDHSVALQDKVSFALWLLSAIAAAWIAWAGTAWLTPASAILRWARSPIPALRISSLRILQFAGILAIGLLLARGLGKQLELGRENVDLGSAVNRISPDAEAALWVQSHTDPKAVIMARQVPTAYHFSKRKIVWFPPSSNSHLLMDGILKHKVDFIMVVRREDNYYLPSDEDCFRPLLKTYPDAFRLVSQSPDFRIFAVAAKAPLLRPVSFIL